MISGCTRGGIEKGGVRDCLAFRLLLFASLPSDILYVAFYIRRDAATSSSLVQNMNAINATINDLICIFNGLIL